MLADIDTVVFDIQDIGTRFYTYISTMGEAMIACTKQRKKFVVLDRPNPINGIDVKGPMLDPKTESFVGFHRLPVRHGMTIGELAVMFRDELDLDLDLQVVPCEGWSRRDYWDRTGLLWVNPSPNMRVSIKRFSIQGLACLRQQNLSVGRGTDTPFEMIGAPWIDGRALALQMNAQRLPGVVFVPVEFSPTSSKFADELCQGIHIAITDRSVLRPIDIGLTLAAILRRSYPDDWQTKNLNRLLGSESTYKLLLAGKLGDDLVPAVSDGMSDFIRRRETFLLYE